MLEADGFGGFTGDIQPGQTFYFSWSLTEELASDPILQLSAYGENIAVFLDGMLIYTDCPEQDNRIGHLALPQRAQLRSAALTVSLPGDCAGKTVTIAQSTGFDWEMPKVWPVPVLLTCPYAHESELIAESFRTAVPAALCFFGGGTLLALFLGSRMGGVWGMLLSMPALMAIRTVYRVFVQRHENN